ncbi:IclR family transcriptional regulator [Rhodococcus ruber]|uniref:IclR family transcriptional regulator n=1 Tax=Rhodococcus ruber TaxID=1830 RepID=A0ABT4ML90_9NOCA|nr:IclR family transcriptional regulator [Rhodococcus ruber]MCZ4521752.1 IclR family transcriptional regulator [Rhodococcus ruber]
MNATATYPIESVDNAATILLMFRGAPGVRVAQVAQDLGVARSTAHRMLTTLQASGLLRQNPGTKVYEPGPGLIEIGHAVIGASDLRTEIRPLLESVSAATKETTHLLVLENTATKFIDGVEGRHIVRSGLRVGERGFAHASAAGKVMLADLSTEELTKLYPSNRLSGGTGRAIRTRSALIAALDEVRERGYAINDGESEPDLYAVAAGIRDHRGAMRAAVSISGPKGREGLDLDALGLWLIEHIDEARK